MKRLILLLALVLVWPAMIGEAGNAKHRRKAFRTSAAPTPDILWWKLNEGSGISITGDGTNGGDDATTDADWTTGASGSGGALNFNGTTDEANTSAAITFGSNIISISFHVYLQNVTATAIIAESTVNGSGTEGGWIVFTDSSGAFAAGFVDGTLYYETFPISAINTWAHVFVLLDNSGTENVRLWIDGVEQTATSVNGATTATDNFVADTIYTGARNSASLFLDGYLDDLRIWSGDQTAYIAAVGADKQ